MQETCPNCGRKGCYCSWEQIREAIKRIRDKRDKAASGKSVRHLVEPFIRN